MTSPRPPVFEKGAHSAPTTTTFIRSSALTTREERERVDEVCAGERLAATALRLKSEGAKEGDDLAARPVRIGAAAAKAMLWCRASIRQSGGPC